MAHLILTKRTYRDQLTPGNQATADFIHSLPAFSTIHGEFRKMRNVLFHRKMFALFNFLYDQWQPGELQGTKWKGVVPQKSFEQFRKDLIILAGFYQAFYRLDGSVRIEAKSISFGSMDQEEFEELYSKIIDVGLNKILPQSYDKKHLDEIINELLAFS